MIHDCTHPNMDKRPTMLDIVQQLREVLQKHAVMSRSNSLSMENASSLLLKYASMLKPSSSGQFSKSNGQLTGGGRSLTVEGQEDGQPGKANKQPVDDAEQAPVKQAPALVMPPRTGIVRHDLPGAPLATRKLSGVGMSTRKVEFALPPDDDYPVQPNVQYTSIPLSAASGSVNSETSSEGQDAAHSPCNHPPATPFLPSFNKINE